MENPAILDDRWQGESITVPWLKRKITLRVPPAQCLSPSPRDGFQVAKNLVIRCTEVGGQFGDSIRAEHVQVEAVGNLVSKALGAVFYPIDLPALLRKSSAQNHVVRKAQQSEPARE